MVKKLTDRERMEALKAKLSGMGGGKQGFFSPPVGVSTIRILPEVGNMVDWYQVVGRHYHTDKTKSVYCPKITSGGELECPICERSNEFYRANEKDSAKLFYPSTQFWMNVIVRGTEGDPVPVIYTPGKKVMDAIVAIWGDPEYNPDGDTPFYDAENGVDLKITKSGEGIQTQYSVAPARKSSPFLPGTDTYALWKEFSKTVPDLSPAYLTGDPEKDDKIKAGHTLWIMQPEQAAKTFGLDDDLVDDDEDVPVEDDDDEEAPPPKRSIPGLRR